MLFNFNSYLGHIYCNWFSIILCPRDARCKYFFINLCYLLIQYIHICKKCVNEEYFIVLFFVAVVFLFCFFDKKKTVYEYNMIYSHFVFSLDECRSFGQTKSVEFIQGLPSILPSSYVLKYAHLPWIKTQNYIITVK